VRRLESIIGYSVVVHAVRATGAWAVATGYFERYLILPQIKQLGAAVLVNIADPAGHQSAVGKWRSGSKR
jgi:hypothetical protein